MNILERQTGAALSSDTAARKCVLFSHVSHGPQDYSNWDTWRRTPKAKRPPITELPALKQLVTQIPKVLNALAEAAPNYSVLVLFLAPEGKTAGSKGTLERYIEGKAKGEAVSDIRSKAEKEELCALLLDAKRASEEIQRSIRGAPSDRRRWLRILTPLDLDPLFMDLTESLAEEFRYFFVGSEEGSIRYDTPKIIEAIVRLRLLDAPVPVFRVDHDVLFSDENSEDNLRTSLAKAMDIYEARSKAVQQHGTSAFIFSGQYKVSAAYDTTASPRVRFLSWNQAFATRVLPALLFQVDRRFPKKDDDRKAWEHYCVDHFDEELVRDFYGIQRTAQLQFRLQESGLVLVGPHPLNAVVSGALLCYSTGIALDVPPFSNMCRNVMWVDDHLKYSLCRELRRFAFKREMTAPADHPAVPIELVKPRQIPNKVVSYVFGDYLPSLLRGCILDCWICDDYLMKLRREDFRDQPGAAEKEQRWINSHTGTSQGTLTRLIVGAVRKGRFSRGDVTQGRRELAASAFKRVREVRDLWRRLQQRAKVPVDPRPRLVHTFASAWALGRVRPLLGPRRVGEFFKNCATGGLWEGLTPLLDESADLEYRHQLNPAVNEEIDLLVEDALEYVQWVLAWPRFVQIVRAAEEGTFVTDIYFRG